MPFDPLLILLFGLLAVMIFFTWRNGKKRKAEAEDMQAKLLPGADIMTQHGIFGTLISIDDETNEAVIESTPGTQLRVHRQTISRVVDPDAGTDEATDELDEGADADAETELDERTDETGGSKPAATTD